MEKPTYDELLEALADVTAQGCGDADGNLNSYALHSYADAIRLLVAAGVAEFVGENNDGRMVRARWLPVAGPQETRTR
jgi:hypothetical protein